MLVYFCDRLGDTSEYPQFIHLLDALTGSVSKVMVGEFSREGVIHAVDTW